MDTHTSINKKRSISATGLAQQPRLPLKETNHNVPSPVLKKAKLNKVSNAKVSLTATSKPNLTQNSKVPTKSTRLVGADLLEWQMQWKKIMKESIIYFEGVEEHNTVQHAEYKKAAKAFKQVGCKISPFYDSNVTIIISRRNFNSNKAYHSNDIFSNAVALKTKVWDYDKVFRFLKNLGVLDSDNFIIKDNTDANTNLYNLLKEEKIFGSADRDPNAKRDDFHYFDKNYLFIYDLAQKVRPIAIREWNQDAYPVLNLTLDGKCPFIPDTSENTERKRLRRIQKFEATKDFRELLKKVTNDIINNAKEGIRLDYSGISGASTSTDDLNDDEVTIIQNSTSSKKLDLKNEEVHLDEFDERDLGNEKIEETEDVAEISKFIHKPIKLNRNSSCIQPSNFFDVAASGYNGASNAVNFSMDSTLNSNAMKGNGLGPSVSQVPSRNLNNLKRRIILKKQKQRQQPSEKEKDSKPGYCENCRVKYDCFDDHINSNRHRNFACDNRNFKDIDNLIMILNDSKSMGYVTSNGDFKYA